MIFGKQIIIEKKGIICIFTLGVSDYNNFIVIIMLLAISLASILLFQFNWISDLNRLNEDRFKKDIQDVLYIVNQRLEEKEIINLTKDNLQATFKVRRSNNDGVIELIESTFNKKTINDNEITTTDGSLQFDIESGDNNQIDNIVEEESTPMLFSEEKSQENSGSENFNQNEDSQRLFDQEINEDEDFEIPAFLRKQKF